MNESFQALNLKECVSKFFACSCLLQYTFLSLHTNGTEVLSRVLLLWKVISCFLHGIECSCDHSQNKLVYIRALDSVNEKNKLSNGRLSHRFITLEVSVVSVTFNAHSNVRIILFFPYFYAKQIILHHRLLKVLLFVQFRQMF